MSRRKQSNESQRKNELRRKQARRNNKRKEAPHKNTTVLFEVLSWFVLGRELFAKEEFHGNTKWIPGQLISQALIWSWQETKNVTDAFDQTLEICEDLGLKDLERLLHFSR